MLDLENFTPQVIPQQHPYPLVRLNSFTYAQIGTVVLLNPQKGIEAWPVVEGLFADFANGQILMSGNRTPEELFVKLDVHKGEGISWKKFIDMVGNLWESNDFKLTGFWYDLLEQYNVTVHDKPEHIYLFISVNSLSAQDGGDVFFYINSHDVSLSENNLIFNSKEYENMKWELHGYKIILPSARLHVLYESDDAEERAAMERIRTDIEESYIRTWDDMEDGENVDKAMDDLIHVAETLHENFINEKELMGISKSKILDVICSRGGFDPKRKDWIWRVLVDNHLVKSEDFHNLPTLFP